MTAARGCRRFIQQSTLSRDEEKTTEDLRRRFFATDRVLRVVQSSPPAETCQGCARTLTGRARTERRRTLAGLPWPRYRRAQRSPVASTPPCSERRSNPEAVGEREGAR